jgi:hypothetical protein
MVRQSPDPHCLDQARALEARRLIIVDATNVETAAFEVGYKARHSSAVSILECSERRPGVTFPR